MPGNSTRRGAGHKGKGNTAGSGGRVRRSLEGKGPTPKAEDRPYHKAYKAKKAAEHKAATSHKRTSGPRTGRPGAGPEWVVGRNAVLEALAVGLPVEHGYVADGAERDDRLKEFLKLCIDKGLPLIQTTKFELDRLTGGTIHQGVALKLPAYEYAHADDLLADALETDNPIIVALDQIQDPRNLGAIVRSAAAFGATGVIIPERRSASMTAAAWKTSAGAAARIPIAKATNLNRTLVDFAKAGFTIIGLAGEGESDIASVPGAAGPVVLVVGSEESGLARLTRDHCDALASISIASEVESLNAGVAAGIGLYELSHLR